MYLKNSSSVVNPRSITNTGKYIIDSPSKERELSKIFIVPWLGNYMTIRAQLSNVLSVIAELTHNDVNQDVPDTWVTDRIDITEEETRRHINELVSLGLVRQLPRFNQTADEHGREYQLIGITREGLQELTLDQEPR